eukprot:TRINITY_DN1691_c1_g1_i12.p1 TRINITY_DN1691_c1_g1~~TRINITY_DN1691_c1_g1_i12.p1  ORF type:complete len:169 (+),score=54.10 TRINITY_DN1691_c1_g1_i12:33-509(+)
MAWTWAGFWMDDPVFRYKDADFFQSGRHKAEERFWRNYIHDSGGYKSPAYWRYRQTTVGNNEESENNEEKKDEIEKKDVDVEKMNSQQEEEDMKKIKELEDKKKEVEELWNELRTRGWKRREAARNLKTNEIWEREDDESTYVCSVCSNFGDDKTKKQ